MGSTQHDLQVIKFEVENFKEENFISKKLISNLNLAISYQNQQIERKHYHKDPCKMHPVANWMVVALFQDDCSLLSSNNPNNNNSSSNSSNCSNTSRDSSNHSGNGSSLKTTSCIGVQKKRFDIQLNDLNNGKLFF